MTNIKWVLGENMSRIFRTDLTENLLLLRNYGCVAR
jgi:hypothetical protein